MKNNSLLSHRSEEPEKGVLYVVGTAIGNLNDISPRAINLLKNVSLVACEDTRQTKKIMSKYEFTNTLTSFNKNNSHNKTSRLINELNSGKSVALVSDAGMPSICDPGEELVKNATSRGINVICIPGPCAAIAALVSSGLPSSKFIFEGFLPKKKAERNKILFEISKNDKTTILFESPHRLKKLLFELKEFIGGDREVKISRELTKKFEEHIGENLDEVIDYFQDKDLLGEFTIVIRGENKKTKALNYNQIELKKELNDLIEAGLSLSQASKYLAKKYNIPKSIIYSMN